MHDDDFTRPVNYPSDLSEQTDELTERPFTPRANLSERTEPASLETEPTLVPLGHRSGRSAPVQRPQSGAHPRATPTPSRHAPHTPSSPGSVRPAQHAQHFPHTPSSPSSVRPSPTAPGQSHGHNNQVAGNYSTPGFNPSAHNNQVAGNYSTPGFIPSEAFKSFQEPQAGKRKSQNSPSKTIPLKGRLKYALGGVVTGGFLGGILGVMNMTFEGLTVSQSMPQTLTFMLVMMASLGGFAAASPDLIEEQLIRHKIIHRSESLLDEDVTLVPKKYEGNMIDVLIQHLKDYQELAKDGLRQIKERIEKLRK